MHYLDVDSKAEAGEPPPGHRYLDFMGGTREMRCFLVPKDLPRAAFMERHADLLDPALLPVFQSNGICVRQDASYALPAFYIVSLATQYASFDRMGEALHMRTAFVTRAVRQAMREVLGIEYIHLYYEEKPDASCNVHYWLMPVRDPDTGATTVITRLDVKKYLLRFRFSERREEICRCNERMREHLAATGLAEREAELCRLLEGWG